MDHKTCAIYIAEGSSSLFQPACLSVHLFAHPLNLGFPSFTQLPITKFQIKKDAAYVSNNKTDASCQNRFMGFSEPIRLEIF